MNDTCCLLLCKFWGQNECLHVEAVEEKLETISLNDVVGVDHKLALDHGQLL